MNFKKTTKPEVQENHRYVSFNNQQGYLYCDYITKIVDDDEGSPLLQALSVEYPSVYQSARILEIYPEEIVNCDNIYKYLGSSEDAEEIFKEFQLYMPELFI